MPRAIAGVPLLVGINGAQGSGKTTLCRFLGALLAEHGLRSAVLSLDDLYLPRMERQALARTLHPLFATRGVPGTHDVPLATAILDALLAGEAAALPQFDKSIDDRAAETVAVPAGTDIVLFEGWCVGAPPQPAADLVRPINRLEAEEDADGVWRGAVNAALAGDYARLFARIGTLVMLRPPGFGSVFAARRLQEEKLRARGGGAQMMDDAALERFIQHYERLTRHMLAVLPERADVRFDLDARQNIVDAAYRGLTM
ncbi:MAG: kinase [Sphingomonas sp.]